MNYMKNYQEWLNNKATNYETKSELLEIRDNENEIKERFCKNLQFGTGGLRGVIGAGSNRINIYTIRQATQGLANFINGKNLHGKSKSVAIAYDSRRYSNIFALEAALVLAANEIKVYLFESLRPTPELSFAVRHLHCDAGIVITASHNPPEYNGYKVYGPDGGQITINMAEKIIKRVENVDIFCDVRVMDESVAFERNMIVRIGEEIDSAYLNEVINLSKEISGEENIDLKIVYTPLHGTGLMLINRVLSMINCKQVHLVNSQIEPDSEFPTVKSPNPEEREALAQGISMAIDIDADIVLGTDPDCDRVGVAVKGNSGNYELLTGNQIGALLVDYILSNRRCVDSKDAIIKTIVTSDLGVEIAKSYGATVFNTLTGFKFIGEKIKEFEEEDSYRFLFGYEESYGYLAGTFVRDKDAIISTVLIVKMAAYYKKKGMTLIDAMESIYQKYGYYLDVLSSYTFNGVIGQLKIKSILDKFRDTDMLLNKFKDISIIEDFLISKKHFIKTNLEELIDLPKADVLKVHFSDGSWFALRPSGTEPKLKIYYSCKSVSVEKAKDKLDQIMIIINNLIED